MFNQISLRWLVLIVVFLILCSGFFSMAETSLMSLNRYRLKHLVSLGDERAQRVEKLLGSVDQLLSVLLLGNNFLNACLASISTLVVVEWLGEKDWVVSAGTVFTTLVIVIFAEITPKIIGATYPEQIALGLSGLIQVVMYFCTPIVMVINVVVQGLLKLLRIRRALEGSRTILNLEELRTLVEDHGHAMVSGQQGILLNLFSLKDVLLEHVMVPRLKIEGIDLTSSQSEIEMQLETAHHSILLLYERDMNQVVGVLSWRKVLLSSEDIVVTADLLRSVMQLPLYVPIGTTVLDQLKIFQDSHQKVALVLDEYGDLKGLVSLEDILEEIVGKFSNASMFPTEFFSFESPQLVLVNGACSVRDLNRRLQTNLDENGPTTLNGLILETLEDIPEIGTSLKMGGVVVEIVQTEDRMVRQARLHLPQKTS